MPSRYVSANGMKRDAIGSHMQEMMLDYAQGYALAAVYTSVVQRRVSPGLHVVAAAAVSLRALGKSDVFFVEEVDPAGLILSSVQVAEVVNDLGRD